MASIHSGFDGPREKLTERLVAAMQSPHVDCIGHPTGRKINRRPSYELDFERVCEVAVETGTFLEINAQPDRLDLTDTLARAAVEAGVRLVISTDAHRVARARQPRARRRSGAPRLGVAGAGRQYALVGRAEEDAEVVSHEPPLLSLPLILA